MDFRVPLVQWDSQAALVTRDNPVFLAPLELAEDLE